MEKDSRSTFSEMGLGSLKKSPHFPAQVPGAREEFGNKICPETRFENLSAALTPAFQKKSGIRVMQSPAAVWG